MQQNRLTWTFFPFLPHGALVDRRAEQLSDYGRSSSHGASTPHSSVFARHQLAQLEADSGVAIGANLRSDDPSQAPSQERLSGQMPGTQRAGRCTTGPML